MADEKTDNAVLELPDIGSDRDAWGAVLNDRVIARLDRLLGQMQTIALAGSDVTLTDEQWISFGYILTGTLTANVNIIVPLIPASASARRGMRVISNETSGAFTVTFKTAASGSTGVTVDQGARALVQSDGTHGRLLNTIGGSAGAFPPARAVVVLTSTTSWTVPADVTRVFVELWGGGGGGGGTSAINRRYAATPGGGGAYSAGWKDVTPGTNITVTVGAAGTAGTGAGGTGGTTTFGSAVPMSATGGQGGQAASMSPTSQVGGGTASGGDLNFDGAGGGGSQKSDGGGWFSGPAGAAPRGGFGGFSSSSGGATGGSPGGGGGAGGSADGPDTTAGIAGIGGPGAPGLVIITW